MLDVNSRVIKALRSGDHATVAGVLYTEFFLLLKAKLERQGMLTDEQRQSRKQLYTLLQQYAELLLQELPLQDDGRVDRLE
jgi:hypothetical protein